MPASIPCSAAGESFVGKSAKYASLAQRSSQASGATRLRTLVSARERSAASALGQSRRASSA